MVVYGSLSHIRELGAPFFPERDSFYKTESHVTALISQSREFNTCYKKSYWVISSMQHSLNILYETLNYNFLRAIILFRVFLLQKHFQSFHYFGLNKCSNKTFLVGLGKNLDSDDSILKIPRVIFYSNFYWLSKKHKTKRIKCNHTSHPAHLAVSSSTFEFVALNLQKKIYFACCESEFTVCIKWDVIRQCTKKYWQEKYLVCLAGCTQKTNMQLNQCSQFLKQMTLLSQFLWRIVR